MIYTYETLGKRPKRFEIQQGMMDKPFIEHPDSGVPIRRVITGGSGFKIKSKPAMLRPGDYANAKCAMPD